MAKDTQKREAESGSSWRIKLPKAEITDRRRHVDAENDHRNIRNKLEYML